MPEVKKPLLEVKSLTTSFRTDRGLVRAVDDVSFTIDHGQILGIVGESGSGKSMTSQSILRLIGSRKSEQVNGEVLFEGQDLLKLQERQMQKIRGKEISLIAQDPMTSLNPVYTVGNQIAEVPMIHEGFSKKNAWVKAIEMIKRVGIPSAEVRAAQYPHEFSGGMRQRGVIAMALAGNPKLLIADEPTTALDVTIQSQILELILNLRNETGAGIMLITHDLGVVAEICDQVAVMYAGKIVEKASVVELFSNPKHPYTQGLLASLPKLGDKTRLTPIPGQPPNLHHLSSGCAFADRCPFVMDKCRSVQPALKKEQTEHQVACLLFNEEGGDENQ
ncbi:MULTISPECIES: ABC transporter ATP-binding protein [unclassified Sporosarcina]|uniref:ABC transporter ATP-binding protein n=1 Tax=unclassified Sporosarcina TaxID=2647733 RepID=UPI00203BA794|nr:MULTISPECIES: ABC transporter ATP-binding protein [unclassified Sporosarcina]GKV65890.1 peptide ABC transporter ATP-binding protein [Sporosarcina sp. NCCP-2331]GLB56015.1 peptide ABC transporter ATP-binding protein [Sporosarcina sp. NCCP-2378]